MGQQPLDAGHKLVFGQRADVEAGDLPILDEKGLRHSLDAIGSGDPVGWVEGIGVGNVELVEEGPRFALRVFVAGEGLLKALENPELGKGVRGIVVKPSGLAGARRNGVSPGIKVRTGAVSRWW